MKIKLEMFNTEADLQELTGLTHDGLLEAGFILDDWDIGFQTDEHMLDGYDDDGAGLTAWLTQQMYDWCCGYREFEYNGKFYYLVYHS